MVAVDGKSMFEFIIDHSLMGRAPDGHFSTYLDDHFDFTAMAIALEQYVQERIKEAMENK
jgi:hypothetical protein